MNLTGRRRFAGITSQNPAALTGWSFAWKGPDNATVINAHGLLVPLSGSLRHSADLKMLKDYHGNEVSVLATNEKLTIEVVATPDGAPGADSFRDAAESATFPAPNGWVTISGAPSSASGGSVIPMGTFADGFNGSDWMYNSDGSIEFSADGEWGMRFTLTRRPNLAAVAAVVI